MYQFILLIHVFIAIFIIALVLVQQGKGATMGAAFGSGASSTVFGSRGSGSFLFRVTMSLVAVFFVTSIALNYIAAHSFKAERGVIMPLTKPNTVKPNPIEQIPVNKTPVQTAPVAPAAVTPNELPVKK